MVEAAAQQTEYRPLIRRNRASILDPQPGEEWVLWVGFEMRGDEQQSVREE
jgi:hypothetical protein